MPVMFELESSMNPARNTKSYRYPFSEMEEGDSFIVRDRGKYATVRTAVYQYSRRHGCLFSTKTTDDGLVVTLEAWTREV